MKVFPKYDEPDDPLNGLNEKDYSALEKLGLLYENTLYGVVCRIVEDEETRLNVLNRAIITIWQNIDQFDPSIQSFYSWMFKITRKLAVEELRFQMNMPVGYIFVNIDHPDWPNILNPALYEIYASVYYFNNNIESIAHRFRISVPDVRKLLRYAVNEIRYHFTLKLA